MLACLLFFVPLENFHSYGDVTVTDEVLQILTYAGHSWPLTSEGYLARRTNCDTRVTVYNGHLREPVTLTSIGASNSLFKLEEEFIYCIFLYTCFMTKLRHYCYVTFFNFICVRSQSLLWNNLKAFWKLNQVHLLFKNFVSDGWYLMRKYAEMLRVIATTGTSYIHYYCDDLLSWPCCVK